MNLLIVAKILISYEAKNCNSGSYFFYQMEMNSISTRQNPFALLGIGSICIVLRQELFALLSVFYKLASTPTKL